MGPIMPALSGHSAQAAKLAPEEPAMHTRLPALSLLLFAASLLGGCASLSKSECRAADWYDIGIRDGASGRQEEYVIEHAQACERVGVAPDRDRWLAGRERGLERYCTVSSGFRIGRNGGSYSDVCFANGEFEFLRGFELGSKLHALDTRIDGLERQSRDIEARLRRADLPADDKAHLALSDRERADLRRQLRELEFEIGYQTRDRETLEWRARDL
jgi:hypothetical protein